MKSSTWAFGASVVAVAVSAALLTSVAQSSDAWTPRGKVTKQTEPMIGQMMVKLRNAAPSERVQALSANRVAALSASAGVAMKSVRPMSGDASVLALPSRMTLSDANAIAARLRADPNVEWAEPDLPVRKQQTTPPDNGYLTRQWNLLPPGQTFTSSVFGSSTTKDFVPAGGANFPPAWAATQGASSVRVAIIDTGVTLTHPDLTAALLPGYDFVSTSVLGLPSNFVANDGDGRDADPTDPGDWVTAAEKTMYAAACDDGATGDTPSSWHGTHMAGIVAAQWNAPATPERALAGTAPNVRIVPIRALGKCGGTTTDIVDAIRWAAGIDVPGVPTNQNPAKVISLSLGTSPVTSCPMSYQTAINDVVARGAVVVAASGNDGQNQIGLPALCNGVIAVTAHVVNGDNADYANVAPQVAISAPGGGRPSLLAVSPALTISSNQCQDAACYIFSTVLFGAQGPNSPVSTSDNRTGAATAGFTGTSPATPHVAGLAALLLSLSPQLAPAEVRTLITTSARPHPTGGYCLSQAGMGTCGAGLLDAGAAVALHEQRRPKVTAADQAATANAQVTLSSSVAAGTGGGTTFTYQWTQTSGRTVTLSSATAAQPTFTAPVANGPLVFSVVATDDKGYRSTAVTKTVTVSGGADAPAITTQPQNATVAAGQTAMFSVTATGTAPLTYQWNRNGTAINGATAASYTTPATSAGDSGAAYTVTITNAAGSVTSSAATLTVNAPPPSSSGGGGGGALPLLPLVLLGALSLARRLRRD